MSQSARDRKTREWLQHAEKDLRLARKLLAELGDEVEPYHVCFWAQQAAEKAIKAALMYSGMAFDPTHRLDDLAALLPDGWTVRRVIGRLGRLSEYAVDTRYPDARAAVTASDATHAVNQAGAIVNAIRKDLAAHGAPSDSEP
jgi:HEPN domain-containing protein